MVGITIFPLWPDESIPLRRQGCGCRKLRLVYLQKSEPMKPSGLSGIWLGAYLLVFTLKNNIFRGNNAQ
jgi:hypothetical protein